MNEFKLLAIRPRKGCNKLALKILKEDSVYKFASDYKFIFETPNDCTSKIINVERPERINLYKLKNLDVNIYAIVGANGSGKSSLLDFFYLVCYAIAVDRKIIKDPVKIHDLIGNKYSITNADFDFNDLKTYNKIKCELYYQIGVTIYRLNLNNKKIKCEKLVDSSFIPCYFKLSNFFYSIALNYSLYGLNSDESYWLHSLFHKNDGYKTPIVINPFRTRGNIDVNNEYHLANSRLLLNLSDSNPKNPLIINNKEVKGILFKIDLRKNDIINTDGIIHVSFWNVVKEIDFNIIEIYNKISFGISNYIITKEQEILFEEIIKIDKGYKKNSQIRTKAEESVKYLYKYRPDKISTLDVNFQLIKYVIRKIIKISLQHPDDVGISFNLDELASLDIQNTTQYKINIITKNIESIIEKLISNKSHITLKLRQAIFYIKQGYFNDNTWKIVVNDEDHNYYDITTFIDWKDLNKVIKLSYEENKNIINSRLDLAPSALIRPKVVIEDYSFASLSSGEQQLVNTIQTIIYHLNNLNSVHYSKVTEKIKYRYVNIILDEIELYFHPEFQRNFIHNLLNSLEKLNLNKIKGVNFLFATHSPFILSDIPSQNILRLDEGEPKFFKKSEQTFGANIFDLLTDNFYLKEGSIGRYAREKIQVVIENLIDIKDKNRDPKTPVLNKEEIKNIIDIIAEPFFKEKLLKMYFKKFEKEQRKKELLDELNELEN